MRSSGSFNSSLAREGLRVRTPRFAGKLRGTHLDATPAHRNRTRDVAPPDWRGRFASGRLDPFRRALGRMTGICAKRMAEVGVKFRGSAQGRS